MSKLVDFYKIGFENSYCDTTDCQYESVEEYIHSGSEIEAIVKDKKTGRFYKTTYNFYQDEDDGLEGYGIEANVEDGWYGYCKLIEVKGKYVTKIEYEECDDGKEVDERDEWD